MSDVNLTQSSHLNMCYQPVNRYFWVPPMDQDTAELRYSLGKLPALLWDCQRIEKLNVCHPDRRTLKRPRTACMTLKKAYRHGLEARFRVRQTWGDF